MGVFFSVLLSTAMLLISARSVYAIITVIPVILIPIVNILVWIIGALATPVVGLSVLFFKLKKKPWLHGLITGVVILIVIALIIALLLKYINPDRPIINNSY